MTYDFNVPSEPVPPTPGFRAMLVLTNPDVGLFCAHCGMDVRPGAQFAEFVHDCVKGTIVDATIEAPD